MKYQKLVEESFWDTMQRQYYKYVTQVDRMHLKTKKVSTASVTIPYSSERKLHVGKNMFVVEWVGKYSLSWPKDQPRTKIITHRKFLLFHSELSDEYSLDLQRSQIAQEDKKCIKLPIVPSTHFTFEYREETCLLLLGHIKWDNVRPCTVL